MATQNLIRETCDRCGKSEEANNAASINLIVGNLIFEAKNVQIESDMRFDLCHNCLNKFKNWIKDNVKVKA